MSEINEFIDSWCQEQITQLKAISMFLPAGNTVIPLYKRWEEKQPSYLNGLKFYQVDDVIRMMIEDELK